MTAELPATRRSLRTPRRSAATVSLNVLLVLGALVGGVVFSYPLAAPWIADTVQADALVEYTQRASVISIEDRERLRAAAVKYNSNLPSGPLRDPYVINESGVPIRMDDGRAEYQRQLVIDPGEADAPMARLSYPALNIDLPVYHGTDEETLERGVGHFYGSGLPVGGAGVHAVLTAHSGYVQSRLFDDLPEAEIGDVFALTVLGEVLTYRVDHIATALPDESALLRQVQGEDYVTLVTCTPRYVNSHRLLVRGERIDTPVSAPTDGASQLVRAPDRGLPWWILLALGPAALTGLLLMRRRR